MHEPSFTSPGADTGDGVKTDHHSRMPGGREPASRGTIWAGRHPVDSV